VIIDNPSVTVSEPLVSQKSSFGGSWPQYTVLRFEAPFMRSSKSDVPARTQMLGFETKSGSDVEFTYFRTGKGGPYGP
jgi:hypothetical protein